MNNKQIIKNCKILLKAYKEGKLGDCSMPEDSSPGFKISEKEKRLVYFTLPMSLNYQRDSYKLWQSALKTYEDSKTKDVFSIEKSALMSENNLRKKLLKHKVALQPNRHIQNWKTISQTIYENWGTLEGMFKTINNDFLKLKQLIQIDFKKGFPYLSGPKIFNYWSFIISTYGGILLKNRQYIDIAPDTHITKCSILLGVIKDKNISKEKISEKWRKILKGTDIDPIDMHPPLWFWSRNNFQFKLGGVL